MLQSYAFAPREIGADSFYAVWSEINSLKWYFYKFAGRQRADEAMHRTLIHTLTHFNPDGNLSAYVKKLAREITKDSGRLVCVDFLEQTLEDSDMSETSAKVDLGSVSDFSSEVLDNLERRVNRRPEVVEVALEFLDRFLVLCEALINHDTSTVYYPAPFISSCLSIVKRCPNFNDMCIDLYMQYSEDIRWFLDIVQQREGVWKETDYQLIRSRESHRVRLCNPSTGEDVVDADLEDWQVVGNLGSGKSAKRVVRIPYGDIWERMCDLVDSPDINIMKFVIDNRYIIRTLGGSQSLVNTDLYNIYDLLRMEILTNLLIATGGRVLNVGSESMYLLCFERVVPGVGSWVIGDFRMDFEYIDVTGVA